MKSIILSFLILTLSLSSFSQDKEGYLEIVSAENQLKGMFDQLYKVESPGPKTDLFYSIDSLFNEALQLPGSFNHRWNRLDMIGRLESDDKQVKVFSWLYMVSRDEYLYSAYIQLQHKDGGAKVFRLQQTDSENYTSEGFKQSIDEWHGKIYYEILSNEFRRKTFYTLLGADFNDVNTKIKTIEVFAIQRGKPVFRGDQFFSNGTVKDRIVLEYSADVTASLRYNKDLKMIVFDHLAPLHPLYQGYYQFYGPDGSYDGYRFEEGVWIFEEDVDARN
jgi:hypothetical protein